MKKVWFIIPVVLLFLNVLPVSLHKDAVSLRTFDSASPSHWMFLSLNIQSSSSSVHVGPPPTGSLTPLLTQGALFRGFPAAFYFSNSSSSSNTNGYDVKAVSWLWGLLDLGLIVASCILAKKLSKHTK